MVIVVVSGPPGSGKTTIARAVHADIGGALVSKDDVKEALADALGIGDRDWRRKLTMASFEVMWRLAATNSQTVLDANFRSDAPDRLREMNASVLELHCECSLDVCSSRFARRRDRHPVHPAESLDAPTLARYASPLDVGPILMVDTEHSVDLEPVLDWLHTQLDRLRAP
jgi:predicted kinase